jgi:hypothetical protein
MAALIHLTEVLVHGADLAIATGQEALLDEHACASLLTVMVGMDFDAFRRPGMFGPALSAPADAPAHRRLLPFSAAPSHRTDPRLARPPGRHENGDRRVPRARNAAQREDP